MTDHNSSNRLLRVFLCHSPGDKPIVRKLYRQLYAEGFDPWLDEEKLLPGIRWQDEITKAVRETDIVIIRMSKSSVSKQGFVQREIRFALDIALEQPEGEIFLVPLRLDDCEVPNSLREWHYVDFFDENGYERLKKSLLIRARSLGAAIPPANQQTTSSNSSERKEEPNTASIEVPTVENRQGINILPLAIGIETAGNVFTKMIPEGSQLPLQYVEVFSTAADNQPAVQINVLQGLRPMASQNKRLGIFNLDGIPPAPRGVPQIEVVFDIDDDGILHVSAKDIGTGKAQKIRIEAAHNLTGEEIAKMQNEATINEASDKHIQERLEKVNQADNLIYTTQKQLKELGNKLSARQRDAIESALDKLQDAHKNLDMVLMDACMNNLNAAWASASKELYG